ncbi:RTA1 domain protein [Polychaeton citri CBS 116435]|uniref:RTA1 domain protein n=1 Tax=Polychaeton citri CBS 116435 TaxID=1314669 RepID=A0A9P4Q3R1_9PEZI|nr:RTA1 domain protein [Polychaeton citri CBS 116435]
MLSIRQDSADDDFQYYHYVPNLAAAVIFIILFFLSTALHFYQMIRTRTWFMIPFCIGGIFEFIGYVARAAANGEKPNYTLGPYIIQTILLLIAPALLAASIYMELGRIVLLVKGDQHLFIRRTWLTKIFVTGDVLSFLMQASGGGLMSSSDADTTNVGKSVILAGLVLQIIYFALFVLAGALFHSRVRKQPTEKCRSVPWEKHMYSLYIVSILIFVRSIVRVVEFAQGFNGYIMSHEVYLYIFDATLMFLACATLNLIHPSEVAALNKGGKAARNVIFMDTVV